MCRLEAILLIVVIVAGDTHKSRLVSEMFMCIPVLSGAEP